MRRAVPIAAALATAAALGFGLGVATDGETGPDPLNESAIDEPNRDEGSVSRIGRKRSLRLAKCLARSSARSAAAQVYAEPGPCLREIRGKRVGLARNQQYR
jgi:hypothetical protein